MNRIADQFTPIRQITDQYPLTKSSGRIDSKESNVSFQDILNAKQQEKASETTDLKFSKHASMRLADRNMNLTEEQNKRLENGVAKASEKGINESLVLIDSMAFIVNVPNKTVVTAMNQTETNSNVFTNIDGAVIM